MVSEEFDELLTLVRCDMFFLGIYIVTYLLIALHLQEYSLIDSTSSDIRYGTRYDRWWDDYTDMSRGSQLL